jgi:type II secretory pathway pseudopilin PulG
MKGVHLMTVVSSNRGPRRSGMAAIWALVVVAVVSVMVGLIVAQFLAVRRAVDHRHHQLQALWLAQAGIELAAGHLLNSPTVPPEETVNLISQGQVHIKIEPVPAGSDIFLVTSEARYPLDQGAVVRSLTRRFHRVVAKDNVHLEVISSGE